MLFRSYKKKLSDHASFVATCAAITDYMEDRPKGAKLLQIYDRQFALISATVLTYNIVGHQKDPDYLLTVQDILNFENQHGKIKAKSWVLMRTDWSKRWSDTLDAKAYQNFDKTASIKYGFTNIGFQPSIKIQKDDLNRSPLSDKPALTGCALKYPAACWAD